MKKAVKITTIILTLIFSYTLMGFGQEEVRISRNKHLSFDGESKVAEVKIKSSAEYNYLRFRINCQLTEGDVKIEIFDPEGEKQGTFTVKTDKTTNVGNKTTVNEMVAGSMQKIFGEPMHGEWVIKASPTSAKGTASYDITQGFEPRIDMIDLKTIK